MMQAGTIAYTMRLAIIIVSITKDVSVNEIQLCTYKELRFATRIRGWAGCGDLQPGGLTIVTIV